MNINKGDTVITRHAGEERKYKVVEPEAPYDSRIFIANRWLGSQWGCVRYAVHRDKVVEVTNG